MKAIWIAFAATLIAGVAVAVEPDSQVAATVEAFHAALKKGDKAAVMELLAADAQILESGHTESRGEYEKGHLAADIEFAQAVPSTRENVTVRQEASTAWLTSSSRSTGTFKGREIDSAGTELMVLTKTPEGWRIRAIHWSSYSRRPK